MDEGARRAASQQGKVSSEIKKVRKKVGSMTENEKKAKGAGKMKHAKEENLKTADGKAGHPKTLEEKGTAAQRADTPLGTFTVHPAGYLPYPCAEQTGIFPEPEGGLRIVTAEQQVRLGGEVFAPLLYQSCMRPEEKRILPLTITVEAGGAGGRLENRNTVRLWRAAEGPGDIRPWSPVLKKHSCIPCSNCGRCSW